MPGLPPSIQQRINEADEAARSQEDAVGESALSLPAASASEPAPRHVVELDLTVGEDGSFNLDQFTVPLPEKPGDAPVVVASQPTPLSPAERQQVPPDVLSRMDSMGATIEGLRREIADARAAGASTDELRRANAELQARVLQLQEAQNKAKADAGLQFDDGLGPTEEELAILDPRYVSVVRKMTAAAAEAAAKKVYDAQRQVIQQLQAELTSVRDSGAEAVRKAADTSFRNALSRAHPDIQSVFNSDGFKAFIAKPVSPLSRDTISSVLNRGWNDQDAQQVSLIIDEYKREVAASAASAPQPAPAVPVPKPTSVQPTSSATPPVPSAALTQDQRPLLASRFREAVRLFRARDPRMPKETYDKIERMYTIAASKDRVIYD